jgi:hypothetical protein
MYTATPVSPAIVLTTWHAYLPRAPPFSKVARVWREREVKLAETLTHKSRRRRRSAYLAAVATWGERGTRARAHGEGSQASSPEQPAYRIMSIAQRIITPTQTTFLPGRNIMVGAVILHEIHELHTKK